MVTNMTDSMMTRPEFWERIKNGDKTEWKNITEFALNQFGTALSCNRFAIGEVIENATEKYLNDVGIRAACVPSAKRIDLTVSNVEGLAGLSSKFVSTDGHVILHNAQRKINTDLSIHPTLLFLMEEWWFLDPPTIAALGIAIQDHLTNNGDSLQLKFTLLAELKTKDYPYVTKVHLDYNKATCAMKATSDLTYKILLDLMNPAKAPYLQGLLDSIPSRRPASIEAQSMAGLAAICRAEGIKGFSGKKKPDLIKLITEHRAKV